MEVTVFGRTLTIGIPQAVLALLVVTVAAAVVTAGVTASAPFSAYNADWTGTSDLRGLADDGDRTVFVATNNSLPASADPNATVVLMLGVDGGDAEQQDQLRQFVRQGGTLVVADDVGTQSNPLLATVGASARIQRGPVRDLRSYHRQPVLPVVEPTATERAPNVSQITLNYAGVVEPNGATVLAQTTPFAHLDQNQNQQFDERETLAQRPVMTAESVGEGSVIVISDSSVFVNAMLERDGNRALATTLVAPHETVVLTSYYSQPLPPGANTLLVLRRTPWLQAGILALLVSAVVGLRLVRQRNGQTPTAERTPATPHASRDTSTGGDATPVDYSDGFVQLLTSEHPDWNRQWLKRVVQSMSKHGEESDDE